MRPSARDLILEAAESVVRKSGAAHLTLDAVAEEAGVSKGGLLYHFPSKEALLQGMVSKFLEEFKQQESALVEKMPKSRSADLRAYIAARLNQDERDDAQVCSSMLAAGANNPKLLDPMRGYYRELLQKLMQSGDDFEQAAILWLAVDGLSLLELLQLSPLTKEQRDRIQARLLELAGEK